MLPGMIPGPGLIAGGANWWDTLYSGSNMACDFVGDQYMDEEVEVNIGDLLSIVRASGGTAKTSASAVTKFASNDTFRRTDLGLRSEEPRTNICLQSEDFTTTWVNINTDEPTTNNTAPDGTSTADEIAATSTADQQLAVHQSFTGRTAGHSTICTVFVKTGTNAGFVQLAWDADGGGTDGCFCNFDLSDGSVGSITAFAAGVATSAKSESFTSSYWRFEIVGQIASGTVGRFTVGIVDRIDAVGFEAADQVDNDSIIVWGADIAVDETLGTSYIGATTTVAVTRAQDDISFNDTDWYTATVGTVFVKTNEILDDSNFGRIFGTDASGESGIFVREGVGGDTISVWNGSDQRHAIIGGSGNISGTVKAAVGFNADPHTSIVANNGTVTSAANLGFEVAFVSLNLMAGKTTNNPVSGILEAVVYWSTDTDDAALGTLTTL